MTKKHEISRREFVATTSAAALVSTVFPGSLFAAEDNPDVGNCRIPTARGDVIDSSKLGFTLPTELIIQEWPGMSINWPDYTWSAQPEEKRIADVVAILKNAHEQVGVQTIIDRTIPGIGRNIPRMKKIAAQVPVNIIVTTGWYTLYELPYYFHYRERFPHLWKSELGLEDFMVRDIEEGILDTGVRAAAIKVISDKYGIHSTPDVRTVFRISARAHRRTGAPLLTHSVGTDMAKLQQDVFADDGVDLSRVVLGHLDRTPADIPLSQFEEILQRGSFVCFDGWWGTGEPTPVAPNPATPDVNFRRIAQLANRGYVDQLLLSNGDVAFADSLPEGAFVGAHPPYTQLSLSIIPKLKEQGVSDAQIKRMTVDNPRRMLETLCKGGY
jgi:phosphotriesterase-related protein